MKAAVYTGTRNLYPHMVTAAKSLLKNSSVDKIYFLIEDDRFPYPVPEEIETINVLEYLKYFPPDSANFFTKFTPICLLRAAYTKILPETLDRVLQLDVDTIVDRNIDALWDVDLTGKYFAAVPEHLGTYKPYGDKYYNVGVMMCNLHQNRSEKLDDKLIKLLNDEKMPYIDQDAWNKIGADKAVDLDVKYNECFVTGHTSRPCIVHYAGNRNWTSNRGMDRGEYLDKYDRMTFEEIMKDK